MIHAVGQPFHGKPIRRADGPIYNFRYGYHELAIFLDRPNREERRWFHHGRIDFGYWWEPPVVWIIFRIEGMGWSDCPYTIQRVEEEGRIVPPPNSGVTPAVSLMLCDARDSTIQGIRIATMSAYTAAGIHAAAIQQRNAAVDDEEFQRAVDRRYALTSPEDMHKHADRMGMLGEQPIGEWLHRN